MNRWNRKSDIKHQKIPPGFSMVEIMLAVMILGIGLVMVAMLFPVAADQQRRAISESTASDMAHTAFNLLEERLKRNYFTYPGTYIDPQTRAKVPDTTTVTQMMTDFITKSKMMPSPQADPEKDPWPPGAWTFVVNAGGGSNGVYEQRDYPETPLSGNGTPKPECFYAYPYLRARYPTNSVYTPDIVQADEQIFCLDRRISTTDRMNIGGMVGGNAGGAEWSWDFALRMDPSGAMQAIVFVFYNPAKAGWGAGSPNVINSQGNAGIAPPWNLYAFANLPVINEPIGGSSYNRDTWGDVWIVDRLAGSSHRMVGMQYVGTSWQPIWAGNSPANSTTGLAIPAQGRYIYVNDPITSYGPGGFSYPDPTLAVFSKVLKFAQ